MKSIKSKSLTWFIYAESLPGNEKYVYHSESLLGEAEANAVAASIISTGRRAMITNEYVSEMFIAQRYSAAR